MSRARHSWDHYSTNADEFGKRYESVSFETVHAGWLHLLPEKPGIALDVGAGSGRDVAYLAHRGWEVVAVEPATRLRDEARARHPSARIRWLDDSLPALKATHDLDPDLRYDLILLSAVWMHVPPSQRSRAFRKLANLLKPGGLLIVSLRHGEPDAKRGQHPADAGELAELAGKSVLEPVALPDPEADDMLGRPDIHWTTHVFRSPDDGTGALPLLRHIIINDSKSSTYKLALLRVLVRIADGARGMVLDRDETHVTLPFGLVALYWLKAFKPLVGIGAPPASVAPSEAKTVYPQNSNLGKGLGFVREGFRSLAQVSAHDLRVGSGFVDSANLIRALRDVCGTIRKMPANYITLPGGSDRVFLADTSAVRAGKTERVVLDRGFLAAFGTFRVPNHVWDAMSRYACWIEPAIVNEWCELMRQYDEARNIRRSLDEYQRVLIWLDPERDTGQVRHRVKEMIDGSTPVYCAWTGRRLGETFEIDHCFPFACWPNNDLWNLLPASKHANQKKSHQLPSAELLHRSRDRVVEWWQSGYGSWKHLDQFRAEAFSSLPMSAMIAGRSGSQAALWDSVFAGVDNQRVRLRADQQLREWDG